MAAYWKKCLLYTAYILRKLDAAYCIHWGIWLLHNVYVRKLAAVCCKHVKCCCYILYTSDNWMLHTVYMYTKINAAFCINGNAA